MIYRKTKRAQNIENIEEQTMQFKFKCHGYILCGGSFIMSILKLLCYIFYEQRKTTMTDMGKSVRNFKPYF